jgi:hypothetical protein
MDTGPGSQSGGMRECGTMYSRLSQSTGNKIDGTHEEESEI